MDRMAYSTRLLISVLGYVGLYLVAARVDWALRAPGPGRLRRVAGVARAWLETLWLGDIVRILFYLMGPYWFLTAGWASPVDFGLADLDWISGVGLTLAIGFGSLLLLVGIWWQYLRVVGPGYVSSQNRWLAQPHGWAHVLNEVILSEAWWTVCRSPMLMLAGPYLGVYLGLVLVLAAGFLNPRTRAQLAIAGLREEVVLSGSLAVLSATLYAFVHNLWLCMAMHFVLRWAVLRLMRQGSSMLK